MAILKPAHSTFAGPHFNPNNQLHGAPEDPIIHVGDLENVLADAECVDQVTIEDRLLTLFGFDHADVDDLGSGGLKWTNKTTGNAGGKFPFDVFGLTK